MIVNLGYFKLHIFSLLVLIFLWTDASSQSLLGNDTLVCSGQYITLKTNTPGPYLWSTGETTPSIRVYQDGTYTVNANGKLDTVKVTIYNESFNQGSKWAFGNNVSLQFDTSSSTNHKVSENVLNTPFSMPAGNSTAVNNDGTLLFFTNSETIFDAAGNPIISGLSGDKNLPQNSLVVPVPGSAVEYFVFTVQNNSLYYTKVHVDENKNVTLIEKNILAASGIDNQIASTSNGDNTGLWIMTHLLNSNTYQAIPFTVSGLGKPVLSKVGSVTGATPGYLKFSPDGSRLALANDFTEVTYFDKTGGTVSFPKHLFYTSSYGLEFSPNGTYLYVSTSTSTKTDSAGPVTPGGSLLRANISYGYQTEVLVKGLPATTFGALQIATDQKIYVVKGNNNSNCLGVIDAPDSDQLLNNYSSNSFCTSGTTGMGLPNFPSHYFSKIGNFFFYPTSPCEGDSMHIVAGSRLANLPYAKFSILYNFDDPASGPDNTSTLLTPRHFYPGKEIVFRVQARTQDVCRADSSVKNSFIVPRPRLLLKDTVICPEAPPLVLDAKNKYKSVQTDYLWISGKDTLGQKELFTPPVSGLYKVDVRIGGQCDTVNFVNVTYKEFPPFDLGPARNVCDKDTVVLSGIDLQGAAYSWSNGESTKNIQVKSQGKYWLKISDQGCSTSDTVTVNFYPRPPSPDFGTDTQVCSGQKLTLIAGSDPGLSYSWTSGENTASISVQEEGTYSVTVSNPGCKQQYSTNIKFYPTVQFPEFSAISICEKENESVELDAGPGSHFSWQPGNDSSQKITITKAGDYSISKKDELSQCPGSTQFHIYSICKPKIFFPTTFTPNKDGMNDEFRPVARNVLEYSLQIYNRWGDLIYTSGNAEDGWDGMFNGQPSPVDNYIYRVDYLGEGIKEPEKYSSKGTLILLR